MAQVARVQVIRFVDHLAFEENIFKDFFLNITSSDDIYDWYIYLGCYIDTSTRALPDSYGGGHSIQSCYETCSHYLFFGLQYNGQCWCGNDYASAIQHG